MKLLVPLLLISFTCFANDIDKKVLKALKDKGFKVEYVYHPEWIALYAFDNKNRITKVNNSHEWKVPHHDCILGPVKNSSPETFSRSVTCEGEKLGSLECTAKGSETHCRKRFGDIHLVLKIKKFPTMATRRAIELEYERQNNVPY